MTKSRRFSAYARRTDRLNQVDLVIYSTEEYIEIHRVARKKRLVASWRGNFAIERNRPIIACHVTSSTLRV